MLLGNTVAGTGVAKIEHSGAPRHMETLLAQLLDGVQTEQSAVEALSGKARLFAFNKVGCQVLQRLLSCLPAGHAGSIVDELIGSAMELAQHRFGSRVVCCIVTHHCCGENTDGTTTAFVFELLQGVSEVVRNVFARKVFRVLFEHADEKVQGQAALCAVPAYGSEHGSFVVADALEHCQPIVRDSVCKALLGCCCHFALLAETVQGCRVLRALLNFSDDQVYDEVACQLEDAWQLDETRCGRRLLNDFRLRLDQ